MRGSRSVASGDAAGAADIGRIPTKDGSLSGYAGGLDCKRRLLAADSGKYGTIRNICASDSQIISLMAATPRAAIASTDRHQRKQFNG